MMGVIITFDISPRKVPRKKIVELHRKLYGYKDYSQHGKYEYKRPGLLNRIPHLNPNRSVIVVKKEDANKVVELLKEYTNQIFVRDIILKNGELK
jgi:hypothetical protein